MCTVLQHGLLKGICFCHVRSSNETLQRYVLHFGEMYAHNIQMRIYMHVCDICVFHYPIICTLSSLVNKNMSVIMPPMILGLYSLSGKTSYRQITWRLEAARLDIIMIVSHWNLTGISAALLRLEKSKPQSRGFETSRDLAVRPPSA